MSIPEDFTADERGGGWQTLLELFGEAPVPDKEQWKLAAMYNRLEAENAALKAQVERLKALVDSADEPNGSMMWTSDHEKIIAVRAGVK